MTPTSVIAEPAVGSDPKPIFGAARGEIDRAFIRLAVAVPLLALIAAVPLAWGWGITWIDIGLALGFYFLSGLGVTIGFHRHFTHRSFKANRPLRIGLAIAGSMAFQGDVITWVADHRRHHAYADKEGDPHSPWLFGTSPLAVAKGFCHSHIGWLFAKNPTNLDRFAPDLIADRDIARISRQFPLWTAGQPAGAGRARRADHDVVVGRADRRSSGPGWCGSPCCTTSPGRSTRSATWSAAGRSPAATAPPTCGRWRSLSMGESWHNLHHADPTCARHGVGRGQLDISARLIWIFEKLGWVRDVRWPSPRRLADLVARR